MPAYFTLIDRDKAVLTNSLASHSGRHNTRLRGRISCCARHSALAIGVQLPVNRSLIPATSSSGILFTNLPAGTIPLHVTVQWPQILAVIGIAITNVKRHYLPSRLTAGKNSSIQTRSCAVRCFNRSSVLSEPSVVSVPITSVSAHMDPWPTEHHIATDFTDDTDRVRSHERIHGIIRWSQILQSGGLMPTPVPHFGLRPKASRASRCRAAPAVGGLPSHRLVGGLADRVLLRPAGFSFRRSVRRVFSPRPC